MTENHSRRPSALPRLLSRLSSTEQRVIGIVMTLLGIAFLAVVAQIKIPVPWSPVPITGQTFGVTLIALTYGRKLTLRTIAGYLVLGVLGAPVLAGASAPFDFGPTSGYLIGMFGSAIAISWLADLGFTRQFKSAFVIGLLGSSIVFACGTFVLAFYLPLSQVFSAGVFPFLPGDLVKTFVAAALANQATRATERSQ